MTLPSTDKTAGSTGHITDHNAIVAEIASVETTVSTEVTNRTSAVSTEATARAAADTAETNARIAADAAEVTARNAAITSAISGLSSSGTSPFFSVKDAPYNATGNGTTDDTAAVNAAITAANAAGGTVYFPPGTYSLNNIALKENVKYDGIRGKSILKIRTGASYLASCDSGSASVYLSKMIFTGLTFRGLVDTDTVFDQQRHLLNLNGVENLSITNCDFVGWHGDAIYLGSSNSGGTERHNRRVTIAFNLFDGLTKNNRNCISIIDGEDILIHGNVGTRFSGTAVPGIPGFVDIEPNSANTAFAICRRIIISGNRTSDHNSNFFQINLPGSSYTNEPRDIIVANNTDDAGVSNANTRFAFLQYGSSGAKRATTDASPWTDIKFIGNICRNSFQILEVEGGIVGAEFSENRFEDCAGAGIIGYFSGSQVRHFKFENNTFVRCGATDGNVFRLMFCNNIAFINNKFHSCVASLILFAVGDNSNGLSTDIDWISNQVTGTGTTSISTKAATHTLTAASNLKRAYRENGLTIPVAHFATTV